jgi:hypothetical protein
MAISQGLLWVVCGWYWLGASGAALAVLWLRARAVDAPPRSELSWAEVEACLDPERRAFVHLTPWRVVIRTTGWFGERQRLEIFRDEIAPPEWARLRRMCRGY